MKFAQDIAEMWWIVSVKYENWTWRDDVTCWYKYIFIASILYIAQPFLDAVK